MFHFPKKISCLLYPVLSEFELFDDGVEAFTMVTTGLTCGHISVSISAIHWSKCLKRRVLHPLSESDGTDGNGGGSGVDK